MAYIGHEHAVQMAAADPNRLGDVIYRNIMGIVELNILDSGQHILAAGRRRVGHGFARFQFGVAILLIEHDMNFVMGICEEITVLDYGRVIARGDGKAIRNNPKVIAAYLGGD